MRTLFIIPLVLMSLVSFPSWGLSMDDLVEREGLFYKKFTDVPFSGEVEGTDQGKFKNGKKEASWMVYRTTGQLLEKGNYKNNKRQGYWTYYHKDGQVNFRGHYKNGKKNGPFEWYYSNG